MKWYFYVPFDYLFALVVFIINNLIDQICQTRSIQCDEKERVRQIYHRDAYYYVIISHNSSVPMIGHLKLAIGMLTSHASWVCLTKILPWSRIFLRCLRANLDLII